MRRLISLCVALAMTFTSVTGYAQGLELPAVGTMIAPSAAFSPVILRGMTVYPDKPLTFDFIVDTGDEKPADAELRATTQKLVNYFLAAMTVPEGDLWVNLSPVEKDRIITEPMARTELGRDLLAQDYLLKQLTASLIYPENELGKTFWKRVYDEAYQKFGTTEIPVDTFNKVWIMPETASVYEKNGTVYVTKAHMKVMLASDYEALKGSAVAQTAPAGNAQELSKEIIREIVLPAIETEINEGKNFALLRQVFHSLILAQWYKKAFAESALRKAYGDQNKVAGIDVSSPELKDTIYQQYLAAYKKGVFNYIKEETDRLTNEPVPRKYFSGGFDDAQIAFSKADAGDVVGAGKGLQKARVEVSSAQAGALQIVNAKTYPGAQVQQVVTAVVNGFGHAKIVSSPQTQGKAFFFPADVAAQRAVADDLATEFNAKDLVVGPYSVKAVVEKDGKGLFVALAGAGEANPTSLTQGANRFVNWLRESFRDSAQMDVAKALEGKVVLGSFSPRSSQERASEVYAALGLIGQAMARQDIKRTGYFLRKYLRAYKGYFVDGMLQNDILLDMADVAGLKFVKLNQESKVNDAWGVYEFPDTITRGIRLVFTRNSARNLRQTAENFQWWTMMMRESLRNPNTKKQIEMDDLLKITWDNLPNFIERKKTEQRIARALQQGKPGEDLVEKIRAVDGVHTIRRPGASFEISSLDQKIAEGIAVFNERGETTSVEATRNSWQGSIDRVWEVVLDEGRGFCYVIVRKENSTFPADWAQASSSATQNVDAAQAVESSTNWYRLERPMEILGELKGLLQGTRWNREGVKTFFDKYSQQVTAQKNYPVEGAWPVLKAVALLEKDQEQTLIALLKDLYGAEKRPELIDALLLMNSIYTRDWIKEQAPHLIGRRLYLVAAEIHHWAGGLGPVMKFHGKGMKDLGADVAYIEPWYQLRRDKADKPDGDTLDYTDPDVGLKEWNDRFDEFDINLGDKDGVSTKLVKVRVATGIDENGVRVYVVRDVQPDGTSYYTRMLYNYGGRNNPVTKEESMAFINVATAQLLMRLEGTRQKEQGRAWRPALVHGNDGQIAPLQAVTLSRHGESSLAKSIFWAFTTHTYRNRGNGSADWGINVFLKHMMGILPRYFNAFRQWNYIDHTSSGIRLANWAGAVSNKHRNDVAPQDVNVNVTAVTNGAVPEEMAEVFRTEFKRLQSSGRIAADADYERPTAEQVALTKVECKKRLNEAKIITANGGVVEVDLDRPLIGYSRRLVPEKAGRDRAFTDENIRSLVQMGYNVVLLGNLQGDNRESHALAAELRRLEKEIAVLKQADPGKFPGKFQFVQAFTPRHKKVFLAAEDFQVQDSDNHTGAAEFSEEDITANAGLQGGPSFREGVIVDQGILVDMNVPGRGNTLIPRNDTPESWRETVFEPVMALWSKDPQHTEFYENAALSPRLNRIQRYLITSAAYLRGYEGVLAQEETQAREDAESISDLVTALQKDPRALREVLESGRNHVTSAFVFDIFGAGRFPADPTGQVKGLRSFASKKKELENTYGVDALMHHSIEGHYQQYLRELLSGTTAQSGFEEWLSRWEASAGTRVEKDARLGRFVDGLVGALDRAQMAAQVSPVEGVLLSPQEQLAVFDVVSGRATGEQYLIASTWVDADKVKSAVQAKLEKQQVTGVLPVRSGDVIPAGSLVIGPLDIHRLGQDNDLLPANYTVYDVRLDGGTRFYVAFDFAQAVVSVQSLMDRLKAEGVASLRKEFDDGKIDAPADVIFVALRQYRMGNVFPAGEEREKEVQAIADFIDVLSPRMAEDYLKAHAQNPTFGTSHMDDAQTTVSVRGLMDRLKAEGVAPLRKEFDEGRSEASLDVLFIALRQYGSDVLFPAGETKAKEMLDVSAFMKIVSGQMSEAYVKETAERAMTDSVRVALAAANPQQALQALSGMTVVQLDWNSFTSTEGGWAGERFVDANGTVSRDQEKALVSRLESGKSTAFLVTKSGEGSLLAVIDNAMGGIDLNNISVGREGELMKGVMTDKALEQMLTASPGLVPVIINITPIADILPILGLGREGVSPVARAVSAPSVWGVVREEELEKV